AGLLRRGAVLLAGCDFIGLRRVIALPVCCNFAGLLRRGLLDADFSGHTLNTPGSIVAGGFP
ncbi:MAG: hypothetical protein ACOX8I_06615, partial [Bacillota bacterium]